jgi:hypothetical protein
MTNREIALEYLKRFCAGDIKGMEPLLAPGLKFVGTLHSFGSSREYLDSLKENPPEECGYRVLSVTEDEDAVALFYEYQKPDRVMRLAQLFKLRGGKIQEVLLVFDGRGFTSG